MMQGRLQLLPVEGPWMLQGCWQLLMLLRPVQGLRMLLQPLLTHVGPKRMLPRWHRLMLPERARSLKVPVDLQVSGAVPPHM